MVLQTLLRAAGESCYGWWPVSLSWCQTQLSYSSVSVGRPSDVNTEAYSLFKICLKIRVWGQGNSDEFKFLSKIMVYPNSFMLLSQNSRFSSNWRILWCPSVK
jgi:hypothetical protein